MWQRKQTIYLILVVFLMTIAAFQACGIILQIASGIVAALAAVTISLFKNRQTQMKMCMAGQLLLLLWVLYFGIEHFYIAKSATRLPFYLCLPVVAYIMFRMARAGIKHDDELVRSADRIR
ncbi:MAG: DUF4293 family protein [Prevotellaceae bacterium]|nr:DUF4293 family protein [Prevotellaceae bacterium]MDY2749172.1 DUF4293 family protein [Prevotella sp.]